MTPQRLRQLAERCRELKVKALVPEIKEQLETWVVEFDEAAAAAEAAKEPTQRSERGD
jgi:hypothetical protein